ncbi:hypothetical protein M8C21_032979 [Ambrosia artemisiifolia]|uniref:Uncharacterized protein n=1 Tax=Ambrosia artemisiifolia TaxID=4212 RepID=A0AAD5BTU9_AMBAR|nr:hypothetical protein M8C21_032979 [Ambrosia artemisiifolia]
MKELGVPLLKSSLKGTIRISKNKKRKDKNTNLEKDAEYMASTGNKKARSDPINSLSSHEIETISVLSPTNLVTNVEQSEGPEKEIVNDTTHETDEQIVEGVTRPTHGITCGKGARNAMKVSNRNCH